MVKDEPFIAVVMGVLGVFVVGVLSVLCFYHFHTVPNEEKDCEKLGGIYVYYEKESNRCLTRNQEILKTY